MSDTPRTDKAFKDNLALGQGSCVVVPKDYPECDPWELAMSLEREVNSLEQELCDSIEHDQHGLWRDIVVAMAHQLADTATPNHAIKWADKVLDAYRERFVKKEEGD